MPKLPPISGKKLLYVLERCGFILIRVVGSHFVIKNVQGKRVVIPVHGNKDLKKGTLSAIMKTLGISVEQLIDLMSKR